MAISLAYMKWQYYFHSNVCNIYTEHELLKKVFVQPHLNAHQACWLQRLAKLILKVHYVPGVDNVPADMMSSFNQHVENETEHLAGRHSIADASVACDVRTWLILVTKYVDFDDCIATTVEGLFREQPIAYFGCIKCGASHIDLG